MTGMISVNRNELASALAFAQLGLSKRPVVPVLGGMRVNISSGTLELAAFDYEITARAKVSGEASGPGSALVSGAELAAVVKSLPKGRKVTADLLVSDDGMVISCDGTESLISSLGAEAEKEYPQFPAMPELSGYVDGQLFAASVARVTVCAGTDDTLPVLTHVKVGSDAGMLEMAATDRYRLGVDRMHWTGPDGVSSLVPAVTLAKFAAKADKRGKVALHFGEGFAGFSDEARSLITATSPGEFPNFRQHIRSEDDSTTTVLADAAALAEAVTRAGNMSERNTPVHLGISGEGITVRAMRDGKPASTQVVPCVLEGAPLEISFSPAILGPVLASLDGPVLIGLKTTTEQVTDYAGKTSEQVRQAPAQITSADGFTAVVMPIRKADQS